MSPKSLRNSYWIIFAPIERAASRPEKLNLIFKREPEHNVRLLFHCMAK